MENNNDILKKINSGEPELMAEAIKEVEEYGDLSIAEALLQNLDKIQDPHTVTIIINLLADIKENNFRGIVIRHIQSAPSPAIKSELLRIVWESSLDYSAHFDLFTDILENDDFTAAFEASTVIENMVHLLTEEQHHKLHELIHHFPADKQFLTENIHDAIGCCDEE